MNIAITVVTGDSFRNVVIPLKLLGALAEELREKGETSLHTTEGSYKISSFIVSAKGSKHKMLLIPEEAGE